MPEKIISPIANTGKQSGDHPITPGEWTLDRTLQALRRPLPQDYLKKLSATKGGGFYLPWWRVNEILDRYCPGWCWEIINCSLSRERLFLVGRLTIVVEEGRVYREATGTERLKKEKFDDRTGELYSAEIAYGDPSSNAESMCFRRAAARFGLSLGSYHKA